MQNFLPKESKVFSSNDIFAASCQEFEKDEEEKKTRRREIKEREGEEISFRLDRNFSSPLPKKVPQDNATLLKVEKRTGLTRMFPLLGQKLQGEVCT